MAASHSPHRMEPELSCIHHPQAREVDQLTGAARRGLQEALISLLQSQHHQASAMLSAATRATMGKRGLSTLEEVKVRAAGL